MTGFTTWDIVRNLLMAARWTVALSLVSLVGGCFLGLFVMVMRIGGIGFVGKLCATAFIEVCQGTPLLMQLFLAYFGLGLLGMDVPAWLAAGITLILWTSAFLAEIWRGCVQAIDKGQWEASSSLGLRFPHQLRLVILPQALRIAVPPSIGFLVQVVKGTALTSIIGFIELSKAGTAMTNATFKPLTIYGLVAAFYFALCWPLSKGSQALERVLNAPHQR